MGHAEAVAKVALLRSEVVCLVGICGQGTHPLTELLEKLENLELRPDDAVEQAEVIREHVMDFR